MKPAPKDRLFAKKPRRRRWLVVLGVFALVVLAHLYDPPLDPGYAALMAETKMPPVAENGYYALIGFTAPAGEDPHARGVEIMKQTEEWLRANQASPIYWLIMSLASISGPDALRSWALNYDLPRRFRLDQSGDLRVKFEKHGSDARHLGCWLMPERAWKERVSAELFSEGNCPSASELAVILEENEEVLSRFKNSLTYLTYVEARASFFLMADIMMDYRDARMLYLASLVKRARTGEPEGALKDLLKVSQARQRLSRNEQSILMKFSAGNAYIAFGADENSVVRAILATEPSLAGRYHEKLMEMNKGWRDINAKTYFRGEMRFWSFLDDERNIGIFFRPNATKNAFWQCLQVLRHKKVNKSSAPEECKVKYSSAPSYNLFGKNRILYMMPILADIVSGGNDDISRERAHTLYINAMNEGISSERMGAYLSAVPPELWDPNSGKPFLWDEKLAAIKMSGPAARRDSDGFLFYQ